MRTTPSSIIATIAAAVTATIVATSLTACVAPPDSRGQLTEAQLTSAGIHVVQSEADVTTTPNALTITKVQAARLVSEANLGAGIVGSDLDDIAPVDSKLPTASYLLASWIKADTLTGAKVAATLFPTATDWTNAPSLIYPTAVVSLFVADLMAAASHKGSFTDSTPDPDGAGTVIAPVSLRNAPTGACSLITNFLSSTIQALFDVLRVLPNAIGSISGLGIFGKILSTIITGAIDLAQAAITGLIKVITAPVLAILRVAITALGVASLVISYFSNEKLVVKAGPGSHNTFALDPSQGNPGTFTATTRSLTKDWPAAVVDCARASGARVPELIKPGDITRWVLVSGSALITLKSASSTVAGDKSATVDFLTGHESTKVAQGSEVTQAARVRASIPRKEISDFLNLAANEIEAVKADVLSHLPGIVRSAASLVLAKTFDPIISRIRREITGSVGGILTLKGEGVVYVTFHRPHDEPAPTPSPADDEPGEFCNQFNHQVDRAAATIATTEDVFAWSGAFAAGLHTITAKPPSALADDFKITTEFYDLAGSLTIMDTQPLADFVAANDIDGARVRLWTACDSQTFDAGF